MQVFQFYTKYQAYIRHRCEAVCMLYAPPYQLTVLKSLQCCKGPHLSHVVPPDTSQTVQHHIMYMMPL